MKGHKKQLGAWGESVATTYLQAQGLVVVAHNWRCVYGEIDLVAYQNHPAEVIWHFIEVKTRRGRNMGLPEEALTPRKAQTLLTCAQLYLAEYQLENVSWQIDLMALELDQTGKLIRCEHIPNCVMG